MDCVHLTDCLTCLGKGCIGALMKSGVFGCAKNAASFGIDVSQLFLKSSDCPGENDNLALGLGIGLPLALVAAGMAGVWCWYKYCHNRPGNHDLLNETGGTEEDEDGDEGEDQEQRQSEDRGQGQDQGEGQDRRRLESPPFDAEPEEGDGEPSDFWMRREDARAGGGNLAEKVKSPALEDVPLDN